MNTARTAFTRREVERLALSPGAEHERSAFSQPPFLLVDATEPGEIRDSGQHAALVEWLQRQPCPVIALGCAPGAASAEDALLAGCDVTVEDEAAAATLLATIERAPLAALVLVQLLRATPKLPLTEALLVESLAYATLQAGPEFRRWLAGRCRAGAADAAGAAASAEVPAAARGQAGVAAPIGTAAHAGEPPLLVERAGAELLIRLNRPARRNAISVEMRDALVEIFDLVAADESIERAVVSGQGACFSVGGDLEEFGTSLDPASGHAVRTLRLPAAPLARCAERVHFRVHGACIGSGMEIPAFGARVIAAPDTFFQLPELRFGLIPGAGGCVSIPRRIGRQRAAYLALSGRRIGAEKALEWGLVDELAG